MRKCLALALLLTFSSMGGLAQDARAGVTIDVVFYDATSFGGLVVSPGNPDNMLGPGCTFTGYYHRTVSTGRCMDVILTTTDELIAVSTSVTYDTGGGLELASMYEWRRVGVSFDKQGQPREYCAPAGGLLDYGGWIQSFDCTIREPNNPPVLPAGTYRIGTLIWDTTGVTADATIAAYIASLTNDVIAVIDGNIVDVSSQVVVGVHRLILGDLCANGRFDYGEQCDDGNWMPGDGCDYPYCQIESGWTCEGEPSVCTELAAVPSMSATGVTVLGVGVFGIGVVGLVIAARSRRG